VCLSNAKKVSAQDPMNNPSPTTVGVENVQFPVLGKHRPLCAVVSKISTEGFIECIFRLCRTIVGSCVGLPKADGVNCAGAEATASLHRKGIRPGDAGRIDCRSRATHCGDQETRASVDVLLVIRSLACHQILAARHVFRIRARHRTKIR
jgi:hypothetical protein